MDPAILVVATVLALVAAGSITIALRPDSGVDAAVTLGVLATGIVATVVGVAGAAGELDRSTVVAVVVAVTVVAVVLAWRSGAGIARPRFDVGSIRRHPWSSLLAAMATVAVAWQLLVALLLPVYAYDALTYHGTTLATWLQRGDIRPPTLSLCCAYYPNTAELVSAWPMVLLGRDTVVDAVQIGFVVLAAVSVAGLARSAGLSAASAVAAAALFTVTPIVLAQASTNYVDVMVTAWSLAAVHGVVRFAVTRDVRRLVPASIAAGLVLGTKGTGVFWGLVLIAAAVVIITVCHRRRWLTSAGAVRAAALFVGVSVALGSYWYVRNWIDKGSPLYPFHIEVAGVEVFDGPKEIDEFLTVPDDGPGEPWPLSVARAWVADVDFWNLESYDYQRRSGGLGPTWVWLGLPLLPPVTVLAFRRRNPLGIAILVVGVAFAVQPYRWWSRFTMQLAAMGAIAIVASVAWLPRRWLANALRAAALTLALAGVVLVSHKVNPAGRAPSLRATDVLDLVGSPTEDRTLGRLFFPEYAFVDDVPVDATFVVDVPAEPVRFLYPLFGPSWTRRVLAADGGAIPDGAWVVTATGRPLDEQLQDDAGYELVSDVRDVRAWKPLDGAAG